MAAPSTLRTPDERFDALPGWPFAPRYLERDGLRLAYHDEGPPDAAATALCLHGNPSWSYLYRHMIPELTGAGLRVVAPDLIGFGRSDKPVAESAHSLEFHRQVLLDLIDRLQLTDILLVVQDWGGLLGLTLPMARPQRFTRLLVMNTLLATGDVPEGFRQWRAYANSRPDLAVGALFRRGNPALSDAEAAAYDAPFPDASFKAAVRAFPNLVPDGPDAPGAELGRRAARFWREEWNGESFMAIGMRDPVFGPAVMQALRAGIRNCPRPLEVSEGGHFVQEWGGPIARAAVAHFGIGTGGGR
jgi:pimeloyl-ACP methyl ester carboxylesterase